MKWIFDYSGEWTAWSKAKEGLQYRIQVCDDGTFDISKSDHGLTRPVDTFQRLRTAKAFCEAEEIVHARNNKDYDPNDGIADDIEAAT
jgi:hypothetical protein